MKLYEHLHIDISPRALEWIADAIEQTQAESPHNTEVEREVDNFVAECRARVQHALAGIPDPPENCTCALPGRSDDADWLA